MMETPGKSEQKVGRFFLVFAGLCVAAVVFIVLSAFTHEQGQPVVTPPETGSENFDNNGAAIFENYAEISRDYLLGGSTERTLSDYYARRQYAGSPPEIPHPLAEEWGQKIACLTCHVKGGWTEELKRHTPLTPHPEQTSCRQCHLKAGTDQLFREIDWLSVPPPRLGRSYLPGAPPPIAHDLQMRENCIACHVGPGAVVTIRTEHPSRGYCRQCHVPDVPVAPFQR
ncbi:MAG: cytochrome C [Deltaproteobacteria bacterium]|nr:cytochrome C [Deltaproteobacteria bacterium]